MTRIAAAAVLIFVLSTADSHAQTAQTAQAPPPLPISVPAASFPAGASIAYVNFQTVLTQSKFGKIGTEQLKLLSAKRDSEIAMKSKEVQELESKVSSQRAVLAADAIAGMLNDLEFKQRQLQFDRDSWQLRFDQLNQELLRRFQAQVFPIVEAIRTEKSLLMVFAVADAGIVASHPGLDLSAEVIKRLDATGK